MDWTVLDKVALGRLFDRIASPPVTMLVKEDHRRADNGVFRVRV